jgi:hypothetical protein
MWRRSHFAEIILRRGPQPRRQREDFCRTGRPGAGGSTPRDFTPSKLIGSPTGCGKAAESRSSEVFQTDIHPAVSFGKGIFLDHATELVIGGRSEVAAIRIRLWLQCR